MTEKTLIAGVREALMEEMEREAMWLQGFFTGQVDS